jgi:2-polyprenyl-3-methyl-5-hydroxy-6-metoxy-1,4-benzoquinol methylase
MASLTTARVRAFFDEEARHGRRLLPNPATASGLGSYVKYCCATTLMSAPGIREVIDVGCSVGSIEALFEQQYPVRARTTRIEGVDISPEAIRRASALGLANCAFRTYDGTTLPYASGSFDLAIAIEVIEHVAHKPQFLAEIRRVLRPGGRLFLTTPNPQCWALRAEQAIEHAARWCAGRPSPEKDAFVTLHDLSRLLRAAGFRPVGAGSQPMWPRLYVSFLGWGVLPPLPPRALALYQRMCVAALSRVAWRGWIGMRLGWTTSALWEKPVSAGVDA